MIRINVKKSETGFSLVELGIVLAMLTVMAAIAVPMMTSAMRDMQLGSDVRNIASTMTYAKMTAASQATHYRMSFGIADNAWSLDKGTLNGNAFNFESGTLTRLSMGAPKSGIKFKAVSDSWPAGFSGNSSVVIEFNSRGIPVGGPAIVFVSNGRQDYAVSVSLAGKVQIWKYRNAEWISG